MSMAVCLLLTSPPALPLILPLNQATDHSLKHNGFTCCAINPSSTVAQRIAYYHACCFSPALSTWCTAIDAGRFTTWPMLTSKLVRKYPLQSTAMVKGHLDQTSKNIRSAQPAVPPSGDDLLLNDFNSSTDASIPSPITNAVYACCQPILSML